MLTIRDDWNRWSVDLKTTGKSVSVLIQLSFADNAADNRHIAFSKLWMDVGQKQPKLMRTELVSKQIEFKAKLWNIKYFPPVWSMYTVERKGQWNWLNFYFHIKIAKKLCSDLQ